MVIHREMITPDGTRLASNNIHDCVYYKDKNGKTYMLDGGHTGSYYRMSCNRDEQIIEITTEHKFEIIRDYVGRYNRYSKTYVTLKNISDEWLQNILDYFKAINHIGTFFRLYLEEKLYRAENEIYVPEDYKYQLDYAA